MLVLALQFSRMLVLALQFSRGSDRNASAGSSGALPSEASTLTGRLPQNGREDEASAEPATPGGRISTIDVCE